MTKILTGEIDLSSDVLKCALVDPTFTFDRDTITKYSHLGSDELATGSGYTAGGQPLTNVVVTTDEELGESVLTCDTIAWAATGGDLGPTKGAIIYDDTHADKLIVAYISFGENITKLETESLAIYNFKVILADGYIDDSLSIDLSTTTTLIGDRSFGVTQTVLDSFCDAKGRPDFLWSGVVDFAQLRETSDAISGGDYSTYYSYLVFDGSDATGWKSLQSDAGVNGVAYIGMKDLKRNIKAIKYLNYASASGGNQTSVKVQYSTDLVTWTDIQTTTVVNTVSTWNEFAVTEYASGDAGLHAIRLLANSNCSGGNYWNVMTLILQYDNILDVCTTGNLVKYDENASYPAVNAFDNSTTANSYQSSANQSTGNLYLGQSGVASAVKAVRILNSAAGAGYHAKEVRLSWKQNVGDAWIDLATVALPTENSIWHAIPVPSYSPSGSHYFALRPTTNCAAATWVVSEMEFYTSIGNSINLTASATDKLHTSFAAGIDSSGQVSKTGEVTASASSIISSAVAGRNHFLYQDRDTDTGALTYGASPIVPQYGFSFDNNKHSLLHFDGANASTVIMDEFGHVWTCYGNAALSTTNPKFGTACAVFDGTTDYIKNTTLNIGGGQPFTFECWWRTSDKTTAYQTILGGGGALYAVATTLTYSSSTNYMSFNLSSNGSTWDIASSVNVPISISNDTWYKHIVEFDGYYYRVWHGVSTATMQLVCCVKSSTAVYSAVSAVVVGCMYDTTYGFKGAMDEIRLTIGSNRYGWSPVAETSAFPKYDSDIHYFDIPKMKMYKGNDDSTLTEVQRVFLGEGYCDAQGFTSVRNYALRGMYDTGDIVTTATTTAKSHNLGIDAPKVNLLEGVSQARTQIMSKDFSTITRNSVSWSAVAGTSRLTVGRGW